MADGDASQCRKPMSQDRTSLICMAQYSVFDGIHLPFFTTVLDAVLTGRKDLPQPVPFIAWTESTSAMESSDATKQSVEWHVRRFPGPDKCALSLNSVLLNGSREIRHVGSMKVARLDLRGSLLMKMGVVQSCCPMPAMSQDSQHLRKSLDLMRPRF